MESAKNVDKRRLIPITRRFNRFRAPEARASVIGLNKDTITVKFSGTKAGFACCFDENFIDYQYLLKDYLNLETEIDKICQQNYRAFIVEYRILDNRGR